MKVISIEFLSNFPIISYNVEVNLNAKDYVEGENIPLSTGNVWIAGTFE